MSGKTFGEDVLVDGQRLSAGDARFKVIEQLGSGGNSSVYMVQCLSGPHQGLLFAAKLFTRVQDPARLARFQVELDFLKRPQHPAVMLVYHSGMHPVADGDHTVQLPFYIAEYLPKTLRDAMRSGMLMVEKVSVALQLISALAFLGRSDPAIVHRDIKPENIFIKGRSAVLGDFGLLKANGNAESVERLSVHELSGGIRHPRFYPTPELIEYSKGRIGEVTPKSDVFQLGLVFSELFCGRSPLKERDVYDAIELDHLDPVRGDQGDMIRSHIEKMLIMDSAARPNAADLFDLWDGVFRRVIDDARRLEGRAFW
jgi:eukaryotic-like serine/threonine-protein kinase